METEIIESALAQALDELNGIKKVSAEQKQLIQKLMEKMEGFEQKLEQQKVIVPSIDLQPIQSLMTKFVTQVQATIIAQPKSIVRKYRILLFPEQNAREYYRLVFGRLLFWMLIFLTATYLFALSKQGLDNWKEVKEGQFKANHYQKTFEYLYEKEGKEGKKKMEDAWQKNWESNQ